MSNPISGVYIIANKINGKVYIGQSKNCKSRWAIHKSQLRNNRHYNLHLQRACNRYGIDAFVFGLISRCDEETLDQSESSWIEFYRSDDKRYGYNLASGGNLNKRLSEESRKKMSSSARARMNSDRRNPKLLRGWSGHNHSLETREKISRMRKGIVFSAEHKAKLAQKKRGVKLSEKHREKLRAVRVGNCYNMVRVTSEMKQDILDGMSIRMYRKKYKTTGGWRRIRAIREP